MFAFGRCWCRFRGLCPVWMRVRGGCIPGDHTKLQATSVATYKSFCGSCDEGDLVRGVCFRTVGDACPYEVRIYPVGRCGVGMRVRGVRKRQEQARLLATSDALRGVVVTRGYCVCFCRNKPYTFVGTGVLDCPEKQSRLHRQAQNLCRWCQKLQATSCGHPETSLFAHTIPKSTNPVRDLTQSLLLGMEKVSMPFEALTDEVVHSLFAHTSPIAPAPCGCECEVVVHHGQSRTPVPTV